MEIESLKWGVIQVGSKNYKDIKICKKFVKPWDWADTGTDHDPGIQIADVKAILPHSDVIILTRGISGLLKVPQSVITHIESLGKEVIVQKTKPAVLTYNKLIKSGVSVGALFHTTC